MFRFLAALSALILTTPATADDYSREVFVSECENGVGKSRPVAPLVIDGEIWMREVTCEDLADEFEANIIPPSPSDGPLGGWTVNTSTNPMTMI